MSSMRYRFLLLGLLMVGFLGLAAAPARGATPVTVVPKGQQGCAPGTVVAGRNRVVNGDFSIPAGPGPGIAPAAGFTSELRNVGPNTYPYDEFGGGLSIISTGVFTVAERDLILGQPFLGDPSRDLPALPHYLYTKPTNDMYTAKGYARLWTQPVTLTVDTTYNFFAYFDNMRRPSVGDNNFIDPKIQLRVNGVPAGDPIRVPTAPDQWMPVEFSFILSGPPTGTQVQVPIEIRDYAGVRNVYASDDFAITGISLKQCVSSLGVALTNQLPVASGNGAYDIPFIVTLKNYGVDLLALSNLQVTADLASAFKGVQSFQVVAISSPTLKVNPGFNGGTDQRLLSSPNSLASQTMATIRFTVRVRPVSGSGTTGPYNVQVSASAQAGTDETNEAVIVTDVSVPGYNPDPNNDQEVKDPEEDTPTPVYVTPISILSPDDLALGVAANGSFAGGWGRRPQNLLLLWPT